MVPGAAVRHDERLVGSDRVLAVLVELGNHPEGVTLDELATALKSSKPTVHRALASLRRASLAELTSRGVYSLGDEFFHIAFRNYEGRPERSTLEPLMRALADEYGETVHYAVLDGKDVVYRAKVDAAQGAVRLTSTVGGRNPAYRTAVGKLLLSQIITTKAELLEWLDGQELDARTPFTITDADALLSELHNTRERGYAIDDQENEIGINCVAVPVFLGRSVNSAGALSISALRFRLPIDRLVLTVPTLRARVESIAPRETHPT
ncbi:IclR family transcriptional regulator [Salinibacterium sp. G-O1]|uniref:IclR family transcriptional regulator n=1 Tax=Salinibacterium sp. G-O1 TaxID=3046208 RepID=UPI0024BA6061|nr:IclR family transcriptional regulator [Salinibacterium sp. G-O1]MDJ0336202.1 IclR family transcriptional regulator [Salinibacterium sp. G-O1]